jgi:transposase
LALQVQEVLRKDPLGGHLFCFRGRRGDLLKVLWHDGQGASLFTKRLERRFIWPSAEDGVVTISTAQRGYLLSGIDWRHKQALKRKRLFFCGRLEKIADLRRNVASQHLSILAKSDD